MEYSDANEVTPPVDNSQSADNAESEAKLERYKQQLHGREEQAKKLENRLVETEIKLVSADNSYLLELYANDPELAAKVAQKWWSMDVKEAVSKVKSAYEPAENIADQELSKPSFNEDEMFEKFKRRLETETAIKSSSSLFSKLPADLATVAQDEFNSLVNGRNLSQSEVAKYAEMATLFAQKDSFKSDAKERALAELSATPFGSTSTGSTAKKKAVDGADSLAESLGLGYLYSNK